MEQSGEKYSALHYTEGAILGVVAIENGAFGSPSTTVGQLTYILKNMKYRGSPHGVVANVLDWNIVVSELKLQSRYYIHFPTNTLGKDILPAMG